jgi:hypothetical protein
MRWAVHAARMGTMRNIYDILVGKPEENSQTTKTYMGG